MTLVEVMLGAFVFMLCSIGVLTALLQSRRLTEVDIAQATATTIATGYMEQLKSMDMSALGNGYDTTSATSVPLLSNSYNVPTVYPQPDVGVAGSLSTGDPLKTTPGTPPSSITSSPATNATGPVLSAWLEPSGYVDNLKSFDMTKNLMAVQVDTSDGSLGATGPSDTGTEQYSTWAVLWPNANNVPATSMGTSSATIKNPSPTTTTPGVKDLHMNVWLWVVDLTDYSVVCSAKVFEITLVYTWQVRDGGVVRYYRNSLRSIRSDVPTY
jgi:hypothetical protein